MRKTCIYCGATLKPHKNSNECYACICTERFLLKENAPKKKVERAIKHLNKIPGLLKTLFSF
jgi:predicted choloylglycine hydrolase